MKRVEKDEMWSLMCPNECPGLQDCWGEKFEELYVRYVLNAECAYFVCQFIKHLAINQKKGLKFN